MALLTKGTVREALGYEAIIKGQQLPKPGMPEAFRVLVKELQSLSMNVQLLDNDGNTIDMDALAREAQKEERKINSSIRNLTGEGAAESVVDEEAMGMSYKDYDSMDD